jgi:hypothetical protein
MKTIPALAGLTLLAFAMVGAGGGQEEDRSWSAPSAAVRAPLHPVPYQFHLDEITLTSRARTLMRDTFDRTGVFQPMEVAGKAAGGHEYFVHMGFIDGSYVRDGTLNINESCSINPFENFAFDFSVPVDEAGRYSFVGKEYFGDLVFSAKLIRPRINGPEKFKIGLVDDQVFFTAAMISLEKDLLTLQRQGGEPRTITPFLETTFDEADLSSLTDIEEVELVLRVDAMGKASAVAKIQAASGLHAFHLSADAPWARLNPQLRYSAHVFLEDLANPRIFSIYPQTINAEQLRASQGLVMMKIFGIGFGPDSRLQILGQTRGREIWATLENTKVLMFNMGLETRVFIPEVEPEAYTVRVHTAGMTASVKSGFRVLE